VFNEQTGELRRVLVQGRQLRGADGQPMGLVMTMTMTEPGVAATPARSDTESELRYLAEHDGLTGLLNQLGFRAFGQTELRRLVRRRSRPLCERSTWTASSGAGGRGAR